MLNKCTFIGRLTKDPELKYTSNNNTPVVSFRIAVGRIKREGQKQDADFIPVSAFGKTAENLCKYQKKGSQISVTGRLEINTWKDQEEKYHEYVNLIANEIYYLDKANGNNQDNNIDIDDNDFVSADEIEDDLPF